VFVVGLYVRERNLENSTYFITRKHLPHIKHLKQFTDISRNAMLLNVPLNATGNLNISYEHLESCEPGSSVGIATGYGLKDPEIESR
jgi:hypothetical protein